MKENIIASATFNPKVKTYWVLNAVFISAITLVGIVFIPFIAIFVWIIADRMIKAMSAQLLERKLVVKRGIWFVVEKSIPLEKITDVALSQGPIMRIFDLYSLSFETAGQSGPGALVSLVGVNDAKDFREEILAQKDALQKDSSVKNNTDNSVQSSPPQQNNELEALTKSVQNIETMLSKLVATKSE